MYICLSVRLSVYLSVGLHIKASTSLAAFLNIDHATMRVWILFVSVTNRTHKINAIGQSEPIYISYICTYICFYTAQLEFYLFSMRTSFWRNITRDFFLCPLYSDLLRFSLRFSITMCARCCLFWTSLNLCTLTSSLTTVTIPEFAAQCDAHSLKFYEVFAYVSFCWKTVRFFISLNIVFFFLFFFLN